MTPAQIKATNDLIVSLHIFAEKPTELFGLYENIDFFKNWLKELWYPLADCEDIEEYSREINRIQDLPGFIQYITETKLLLHSLLYYKILDIDLSLCNYGVILDLLRDLLLQMSEEKSSLRKNDSVSLLFAFFFISGNLWVSMEKTSLTLKIFGDEHRESFRYPMNVFLSKMDERYPIAIEGTRRRKQVIFFNISSHNLVYSTQINMAETEIKRLNALANSLGCQTDSGQLISLIHSLYIKSQQIVSDCGLGKPDIHQINKMYGPGN